MEGIICTTPPGLEDISSMEVKELTGERPKERPFGLRGRIMLKEGGIDRAWKLIRESRSLHRVSLLLSQGSVSRGREGLSEIRELSAVASDFLSPHDTFAIRARRIGKHEYTSLDIGREAGEEIKKKSGAKVNLDNPSVAIGVEVIGEKCLVTIELTGDLSLHRRGYRVYDHPSSLKPSIAHCMLRILDPEEESRIVDPMCGGGTIPIEASLLSMNLRIWGMEKYEKHIRGAILNSYAAGVRDKIRFVVWDATKLDEFREEFDYSAVNPPYGIRIARKKIIPKLYEDFFYALEKVGLRRLCLITTERNLVRNLCSGFGLKIGEERWIMNGNLKVCLFLVNFT